MADLLVVITLLAFFGLCLAFVRGCDRIIGPDEPDGETAKSATSAYTEIPT